VVQSFFLHPLDIVDRLFTSPDPEYRGVF